MKITYGTVEIPVDVEPKPKMISIIITGTSDEIAFAEHEIQRAILSGCSPEPCPRTSGLTQAPDECESPEASCKDAGTEVSG
jgi:hypothetical protein